MQGKTAASRTERERAWHDDRFANKPARGIAIQSFTQGLTLEALNRVYRLVKSNCVGKDVLDYGCSMGEGALLIRKYGARSVHGIDISSVAVEQARAAAGREGVDQVAFHVMNAEALAFPDHSFDLIFGIAILHHLDLEKAYAEVARVLRPEGLALFLEPLGHNVFINAVRRATPGSHTRDEHPLVARDLRMCRRYFGEVELEFVNLLTLLAAPLVALPGRETLRRVLNTADKAVFRILPPARRYAWNVVITMRRPRLHQSPVRPRLSSGLGGEMDGGNRNPAA
jgi:SAM-dependent methyltransferase